MRKRSKNRQLERDEKNFFICFFFFSNLRKPAWTKNKPRSGLNISLRFTAVFYESVVSNSIFPRFSGILSKRNNSPPQQNQTLGALEQRYNTPLASAQHPSVFNYSLSNCANLHLSADILQNQSPVGRSTCISQMQHTYSNKDE